MKIIYPIAIFAIGGLLYLFYFFILDHLKPFLFRLFCYIGLRERGVGTSYLEIIPPKKSKKASIATEQLFSILHDVDKSYLLSCEIVSSHDDGIKYYLGIKQENIEILKQHLVSYLPQAHFCILENHPITNVTFSKISKSKSDGYTGKNTITRNHIQTINLKQHRKYYYPLKNHDDLYIHDPIAYIANSMTNLKKGETMAIQILLAPCRSRGPTRLCNRILENKVTVLDQGLSFSVLSRMWVWIIGLLTLLLSQNVVVVLVLIVALLFLSLIIPNEKTGLMNDLALMESVSYKLSQPLFFADIRLIVKSPMGYGRINNLQKGFLNSFSQYSVSGFQSLCPPLLNKIDLYKKFLLYKTEFRLPSLFKPNILSVAELASMYHFPFCDVLIPTIRSQHKALPAPLSMKRQSKAFSVVLGKNNYYDDNTEIGLTKNEREKHLFIIGGTGNGKTTMLEYAMIQDISSGNGFACLDPHGDMAEKLINYIPKERIKDVVYFNPDDLEYPIGLNLLELRKDLSPDDLLREKDHITETVISMFRKVFSDDDSGGHRIEYILRNSIQTALTLESPTIFTIYDLLNDSKYRARVVGDLIDTNLRVFWENEFGKAGSMQRVKMVSGITAKIGRFLFNASAKRILEQSKSTIDFEDIINSGKILICNLSKGLIGEDTSELLGIAILAKLQIATYRRVRITPNKRKTFYIYVDEFQNFATTSFVQLLSESRKYKVSLIMAEQSTTQQKDQKIVSTILANIGTIVCFRTGSFDDEKTLIPLFRPYIDDGEISNLSQYNFYMRVLAGKPQEPLSGETIVSDRSRYNSRKRVINCSRTRYTKSMNDSNDSSKK